MKQLFSEVGAVDAADRAAKITTARERESELMTESYPPLTGGWYLTGPTASGKSGLALELATRIGAEILSLDSMAVYRGLDIGTAKPSPEDRRRVPHHLIDLVEPGTLFSLADYLAAAHRVVNEVQSRGRRVLFVGGTPLYLKGLLRGVAQGPPADWDLRRRLEAEATQQPPGSLHRQLAAVDPAAAGRLHPNDQRRVIRALEFFELTGTPISQWQQQFESPLPHQMGRGFWLQWPREDLYRRIDQRVDEMLAAGWREEVARLMDQGVELGRTAQQAVGYQEIWQHLSQGDSSENLAERIKHRTHNFARKQTTWFRSLPECESVEIGSGSDFLELADRLAAEILSRERNFLNNPQKPLKAAPGVADKWS